MKKNTDSEADRVRHWRELLASERDAETLYSRLAETESGERRKIFEELAGIEHKHAAHWEAKLRAAEAEVPPPGRPSLRTRLLSTAARRLSTQTILPMIERAERSDAGVYDRPRRGAGHGRGRARPRPHAGQAHRGRQARSAQADRAPRGLAPRRPLGALRAGVFGVSDGLVSNTALVMGFAGSGSSHSAILLAGIAGLLAGSFSMAAGEFVSMSSQREMYEREISLEAKELDENPEEERSELVLLYRAKGLGRSEAENIADRIMADRNVALDTLAREELGLDPDALGSPWSAAVSSLLAFAIGAFVVVLPYLIGGGTAALLTAIALAVLAMFAVGAGIGALNGRSVLRSGLRQVFAGALAAAVTYGVGRLIGTSVS